MSLFIFLCKLVVSSGVLFGYYWLFLRNKKFHRYNRIYLLASLIISVSLSLVKIPLLIPGNHEQAGILYETVQLISIQNLEGNLSLNNTDGLKWNSVALGLYSVISIIVLLTIVRSLFYIIRIRKTYPYKNVEELKIYDTVEPGTPFSFFQSIFWNRTLTLDSKPGQQIFRHEYYHVKENHSADILFAEILGAIFWINPFFHFIKKELRAIHEFLADEYAINNTDNTEYAELLIQQILQGNNLAGTSYFFQNHIKRRIAMITKSQKQKYGYWSRILVLPIALLLFCGIALYAGQSREVERRTDPPGKQEVKQIIADTIPAEQRQKYEAALKELQQKKQELMREHAKMMEEITVKQKQLHEQLGMSQQKFKTQEDELMKLKMELMEKKSVENVKLQKIEQEKLQLANNELDNKIAHQKDIELKKLHNQVSTHDTKKQLMLQRNVELQSKIQELKLVQLEKENVIKQDQDVQRKIQQQQIIELKQQLKNQANQNKNINEQLDQKRDKKVKEVTPLLIEIKKKKQAEQQIDIKKSKEKSEN